jgi:biotin carboxyl carrier protein
LAKLRATKPADGDPLDAWAAEAVGRFKEEPGLAIAFAARARRLGGKANGELLAALARLIEHPLRAEERAIAERERRELPAALKRVIEIVEAAGVFEFRRADSSLEFVVPESVASPRARRMLIEELRDTTLDRAATRPMSESEIEEIRRALSAMRGRSGGAFDEEVEACLSLVNHGASIEAETFGALFDGLRRLKWSIRRSGAPERDEREMLEGVGRAIELVRGPSVVAHLAGTVYLKPAPDKPPYVRPGDRVVEDETVVALIENMKMFNEIRAHVSGRVKEVRVENERPILPGEVILVIE